jgi:hypothetical protein
LACRLHAAASAGCWAGHAAVAVRPPPAAGAAGAAGMLRRDACSSGALGGRPCRAREGPAHAQGASSAAVPAAATAAPVSAPGCVAAALGAEEGAGPAAGRAGAAGSAGSARGPVKMSNVQLAPVPCRMQAREGGSVRMQGSPQLPSLPPNPPSCTSRNTLPSLCATLASQLWTAHRSRKQKRAMRKLGVLTCCCGGCCCCCSELLSDRQVASPGARDADPPAKPPALRSAASAVGAEGGAGLGTGCVGGHCADEGATWVGGFAGRNSKPPKELLKPGPRGCSRHAVEG